MTDNPEHGMLPEGWEWRELGEVCEIIMGQSPPGTTYNEIGEGLPFFQGKAEFGDRYPSAVKWCSAPKKIARLNDVLMSVRAPVGPVNLCNLERCCIGRGLSAIRANSELIHHLYLYHFLKLNEANISRMGQGSTFMAIGRNDIKSIKIPLPSLPTQRRIVEILEKADALRKKRRLADEKTSKILQAAFVKMFGDPMSSERYDIDTIGNLTSFVSYGFTRPMPHLESGIPIITSKNVFPGEIDFSNVHHTDEDSFNALSDKDRPQKGDILYTKDGRIGEAAVVKAEQRFCISQAVAVLRPIEDRLNPIFLEAILNTKRFRGVVNRLAYGAALKHISITHLKKEKIIVPPLPIQDKFALLVESAEAMRERQSRSRERIDEMFQGLMQKAFKGEMVA